MKEKWKKIIFIAFFVLLFGCYFWFNSLSKTVDCAGVVEAVTFDEEEKSAFVTVKQDLSDARIEIQIPYTWKCKLVTGGKFVLTDLKVGDNISLNFKKNAVQKDGIYYAIPKGAVVVAPSTVK